jgi:histidinol phosphatase-like PHP family hydrolase
MSTKSTSGLAYPITDYHVHLSDDLTIDAAVALAAERGQRFGIVAHPGAAFDIETDAGLRAYIHRLRQYPVHVGLQPMYVGWSADFSDQAISELDYVLMDADTVPWEGDWLHIWRHDNFIEDMGAFIDVYLDHITHILTNEPIRIFARPTYLPINFARHYDEIWTEDRMRMIIDLAKARNIALEIAENVRVPNLKFIHMAKEADIKFTFGTNGRNRNAGNFHYCIEMAQAAGLTQADMFVLEARAGSA